MVTVGLNEVKVLIDQDRKRAKNLKKVMYSKNTKRKIAALLMNMPVRKISDELGVSKSFIDNIKRKAVANDKTEPSIQLLELPNTLMKDEGSQPIIKFTTPRGLLVEIFE